MLALGLLNADIGTSGFSAVESTRMFRLVPAEHEDFRKDLPSLQCLVADLNMINVDSFRFLTEFRELVACHLEEGALLVCFTSRPALNSPAGTQNKYSWLPLYDENLKIREDMVDKIQKADDSNGVSNVLEKFTGKLYATCTFPDGFGSDPYEPLLTGQDGTSVALFKQIGNGGVLLIPQAEDKAAVLGDVLVWWDETMTKKNGPGKEQEEEKIEVAEDMALKDETPPQTYRAAESTAEDEVDDEFAASLGTPHSDTDIFEESVSGVPEEGADIALAATAPPPPAAEPPLQEPERNAADKELIQSLKVILGDKFKEFENLSSEELKKLYERQMNEATSNVFTDARDELEALLNEKPAATETAPAPAPKALPSQAVPVPAPAAPAPSATSSGVPQWLAGFKGQVQELSGLVEEAERLESEAKWLLEKAASLREEIAAFGKWDGLLYENGDALMELLSEFFRNVLKCKVEKALASGAYPCLRIGHGDKHFLLLVAVQASPVTEEAGRALMRELADADIDTKGVLVVNGSLGNPPPGDSNAHMDSQLAKLAEKRGLAVAPMEFFYEAGIASQKQDSWKPGPLLQHLAETTGLLGKP